MTITEIKQLFIHIVQRQSSHGIPDAFKFKAVLTNRKKGNLIATQYPEQARNPALTISETSAPGIDSFMTTFRINQPTAPITIQPIPTDQTQNQMQPDRTSEPAQPQPAPGPSRRKPRPTGRAKDQTQPAQPDRTQQTQPAQAPGTSRPKPRPTGRAKLQQAQPMTSDPDYNLDSAPVATLHVTDRNFQGDQQFDLDSSLDPDYRSPETITSNNFLSPFQMNHPAGTPAQEASSSRRTQMNYPSPASTATQEAYSSPLRIQTNHPASTPASSPVKTPRRKGKNSDMLALEEAQQFVTNKRRR